MALELLDEPIPTVARIERIAVGPRPVRVGLLGLGTVGQAVARVCDEQRPRLLARGLDLRIGGALVRDPSRVRDYTPRGAVVMDDPHVFLSHDWDVVVEVLGGVEPAYTLVRGCLERGIPVVTANKSLLAAHGETLFALAQHCDTELRCEASAMAGVPFLAALARRPLAARVQRLCGILNGTSNYCLTLLASGVPLAEAVRRAQSLGLAEPDPTRDLSGVDAAEKLIVLLQHVGVSGLTLADCEIGGIGALTPETLADAAAIGGTIKPVVQAEIAADSVSAFAGPAFVTQRHPLARIQGEQNALRLCGPEIGELLYSGPGAGPRVTAGTILDDVAEVVAGAGARASVCVTHAELRDVRAPATAWFVRIASAGALPPGDELCALAASHGLELRHVWLGNRSVSGPRLTALTQPLTREAVESGLSAIRAALKCDVLAIRAI